MSTVVSQDWMVLTGIICFSGLLGIAGLSFSWYDRRLQRRTRARRTSRANAGPHRPV